MEAKLSRTCKSPLGRLRGRIRIHAGVIGYSDRGASQLLDDPGAEALRGHGTGDTEGVLDGADPGSTMADDAGTSDAQQRRTAELLVLETGLELLEADSDLLA